MSRLAENNKKLVYVAMSGGVDSSVAAALLKQEGHKVVGVFMKQWQPDVGDFCIWKEEREEAAKAAASLNIPFKTWDFTKEYKKQVADYMIREYKLGRTPNPDVMCNKEIKFGLFLKRALSEGADFIATGHYVRKITKGAFGAKKAPFVSCGSYLYQGKDKNKDQSYFLWTLKEKEIERCLFPVGGYTKPEIRKLAKKFKLPNAGKKDSQGVCFIGPLNVKDFLLKRIKSKKGEIIKDGQAIGTHDGVFYYTIGQRHGLDIKSGDGPFYVIGKDVEKNIIYVGSEKDLKSTKTVVSNLSWVNGPIKLPARIDVKIRYRTKSEKAILSDDGNLEFDKPVRAITSGQSAVFYRGQLLLGGGVIK
ncbi:MAG: tRNA-specific 2-thiouridylase MnmA [Candidatus Yanofskybacteria bacterium GW2011_GWF1_44_227]|uniref:tRNA-specific 2-thiouridylase MnmA n=1 Tax=Candidatus Yanofskybacteria bacterium GW2011_GWE2_40_11 TaxID=1619033 RepID=A0A0G0QUV6_9BACT|nr:MAG: tRNA-specific 2-thiouridylase MnmA [Candidatus Yanofskybacteria bacterium GW2011_GWE1_40_10]KKR41136.1 MAG: tRNA-specific 2-thiouridylase MnmA [Candidatus Yanofskybacteria bacterium GW2011_GWE2_40_11]KKT15867.1 MAG: tRNA-specific 2-thiouridylase MnmA [Candidatus Yanofskybacteria bacterium GW2011_GWF2_43_596]KKT53620.1 MAG: tRNA-specific 2-thiouridylase MnmA [Candidatus Yanofskybacteria bacterium GW2011_GWF1_44_227]OGN36253.1 MAG: tRNA 2-thiouridine(34) synthase MnmA [Candidatus Yanofsky